MNIAYFITSHGFGHGVRATLIAQSFSSHTNLFIRSDLPPSFFHEEIHRPFTLSSAGFDCGCIQTDGVTVDVPATVRAYSRIADGNKELLSSEVLWCKENNIHAILADTTPFACDIATAATIPSFVITNFTWHDIYEPYVANYPQFLPYVQEIKNQYASAHTLIALSPANPMTYFNNRFEGGIVGRRGLPIKQALLKKFNCAPDKKIALVYLGGFGFDRANWKHLEEFSNWEFFGLYPFFNAPKNYHVIDKTFTPYENLTATADCVIAKIGYSTVAECMCNGTPLIYLPRTDFAEYPFLHEGVVAWGHGYLHSDAAFDAMDIGNALESVSKQKRPKPLYCKAEKTIAGFIENLVAQAH